MGRAASGCPHIPPTTGAIVCAKSIWARAAEVTQKDPAIATRETTSRALLIWHVAAKSADTYTARRGGRPVPRGGDHRSGPAAGARRLQSSPSICDAFRHTRRGPSANTTDADLSLLVHAFAITPRTTSESCAMRPYERGTPAGRIRRLLASSHPRILLQVSFAAVQGDA